MIEKNGETTRELYHVHQKQKAYVILYDTSPVSLLSIFLPAGGGGIGHLNKSIVF